MSLIYRTETKADGTLKSGALRADGIFPLYLTNYPIFHTGSHGTLIFTLTQNHTYVDTYNYEFSQENAEEDLMQAENSGDDARPQPKRRKKTNKAHVEGPVYHIVKTTASLFKPLKEYDDLINAVNLSAVEKIAETKRDAAILAAKAAAADPETVKPEDFAAIATTFKEAIAILQRVVVHESCPQLFKKEEKAEEDKKEEDGGSAALPE